LWAFELIQSAEFSFEHWSCKNANEYGCAPSTPNEHGKSVALAYLPWHHSITPLAFESLACLLGPLL
jgi:hypothetical protein